MAWPKRKTRMCTSSGDIGSPGEESIGVKIWTGWQPYEATLIEQYATYWFIRTLYYPIFGICAIYLNLKVYLCNLFQLKSIFWHSLLLTTQLYAILRARKIPIAGSNPSIKRVQWFLRLLGSVSLLGSQKQWLLHQNLTNRHPKMMGLGKGIWLWIWLFCWGIRYPCEISVYAWGCECFSPHARMQS